MEADSDIILAIFNPYREKLVTYRKYDIKVLKHKFRSIILLKNRYGDGDIAVGTSFFGKCNYWKELPKAEEIIDYEKYIDINYILKEEDENVEADSNNESMKFNIVL